MLCTNLRTRLVFPTANPPNMQIFFCNIPGSALVEVYRNRNSSSVGAPGSAIFSLRWLKGARAANQEQFRIDAPLLEKRTNCLRAGGADRQVGRFTARRIRMAGQHELCCYACLAGVLGQFLQLIRQFVQNRQLLWSRYSLARIEENVDRLNSLPQLSEFLRGQFTQLGDF